jgi:hypothetical protein
MVVSHACQVVLCQFVYGLLLLEPRDVGYDDGYAMLGVAVYPAEGDEDGGAYYGNHCCHVDQQEAQWLLALLFVIHVLAHSRLVM